MTRRDFLAAPAFLQGDKRPNLILLLTDQQTASALSCAGNPWLKTPAMDSLAARGTRYANTYAPYPVCSPSRSTIFTSRMPHETGVEVNGKPIAAGMPTMGEVFGAAGYETVYGGKWHLPKSFDGMTGFTKLIGGSGQGRDMDAPLADACAGWLREKRKDPFLMVASFMNPHDICDWIRKHPGRREHADPDRFPPAPGNLGCDPLEPEALQFHRTKGYDLMSQAVGIASEWTPADFRLYLHDYYRMVEAVDREIGKVLAAAPRENTLILFASDHGEGMGAHRWVQKASFYEESATVPMILTGGPARVERRALTTLADIFPTFCDAAGIAAPREARGVSLLKPLPDRFVVSELRYGSPDWDGRMLRTARYKYVAFNNGARPEQLFDLELDPGETVNLAPSKPSALADHRALLKRWLSETSDRFRMPV